MSERWLRVRGPIDDLNIYRQWSPSDLRRRCVMPGAYQLSSPAVPIFVHHRTNVEPAGWIARLWEESDQVWVEGLVTSERWAFEVVTGCRRALSAGLVANGSSRKVTHSLVTEVSIVEAGVVPTARVCDWSWLDFDPDGHVSPTDLALVKETTEQLEETGIEMRHMPLKEVAA